VTRYLTSSLKLWYYFYLCQVAVELKIENVVLEILFLLTQLKQLR